MNAAEHPEPPVEPEAVTPAELQGHIDAGEPVRLLDVRNRDEVDAWRIDGPSVTATQIPLSRFLQAQVTDGVADLADDVAGEGPITAVCAEGEASSYVAGLLVEAGIDARNLADGMEGWARLYEAAEVATEPTVVQYHRPSSGCLAYLVRSAGEAAVVDPLRAFTDRYVEDATAADAEIVAVADTHVHADHVSGLRSLSAATGARRILPADAAERGVEFPVETVDDGAEIRVGDASLRAVALPGHTTGMTGFAVGDVLLTGDSLFLDGVARPDLQADEGADPEGLARTLHATVTERVGAFDGATLVAPGHASDDATPGSDGAFVARLADLRAHISAFTADESAFVDWVTADLPPEPANAARILAVNRGERTVDDGEAFELELGPNRCAVASPAD